MKFKKIYLLLCTMLCGVVAAATALGPSVLRSVASGQTRAGEDSPVYNETTGTGYQTLVEALDEIIAGNDENAILIINEDQEVSKRYNLENLSRTLSLTIKGGKEGVRLKRTTKADLFLFGIKNGSHTISIEDIIIDGNDVKSSVVFIEISSGTFNLKNVVFDNCYTTHTQGIVSAKGGKTNIENIVIENSTVPSGRGELFCGAGNLTISGNCNISSIYIEKEYRINIGESDLTNTTPIKLYVDATRTKDLIVKGYTHHKTSAEGDTNYIDPTKFVLVKADYSLAEDSTNEDEIHVAPIEDIKKMRVYLITSVDGDEYLYGFPKFHAAHSSTINDDIIVINDDIEITHKVSPAGKGVTIKSADPSDPKTIICNKDRIFFLANAETGNLTFQDVIFDGQGETVWGTTVFEVNNGQLTLENVTIQNYKTKNAQGLISLKSNGSGKITANNLVIGPECTAENEVDGNVVTYPQIFVGKNRHLELSGNCSFSINVEGNGQIDVVGEMTNTEAIPVTVAESRKNSIIVNGCGDKTKFSVDCIEDFALAPTADGQNLELVTTVVVDPEDSPVVNRTIPRGYEDLTSAFKAANAGDLIVVKEDQTTGERLKGKSVTVKGENSTDPTKPVTIKDTKDDIFFTANSSDGPLTFENIVFDGSTNPSWTKVMLEGNGADLVLNDVTIRNYNASGTSIINLKDNNKLTAKNLVIEDCTVPSTTGYISVGQNKNLEISGYCHFSALLNGGSQIEVKDNLDENSLIDVIVSDSREDSNIVIGCEDASKFNIIIPNSEKQLKLEAVDGNLKLVSAIIEDPSNKPVYNQTSGYGFANLTSAISEAKTGDILLLNENQTIDARVEPGAKELTIKGNGNTISRGEGHTAILLLVNNAEGVLNLENVTIDGISKEVGSVAIEASGNGTVNLKDVTFANCVSTSSLVEIKGGGHMSANNVRAASCSVPEGNGDIFVGTNSSIDMTGDNGVSVKLEGNGHINASELSNTTPVKIYLSSVPKENTLVVNGSEDISKFSIEAEGCKLIALDGNIMVEVPVEEDPDDPGKEDPAEDTKPVYNQTSKKGFDTLELAFNAAESGDEIIVKEDQTISERLEGKNVTIKGENADKTISITSEKDIIYFLAGTPDGPLTIENILIDGGNTEWASTAFEANGGELILKNVGIRNYKTTNGQGVISVKSSSNSKLTAENLVIESSCTVPSSTAQIFLGGGNHLEIAGDCRFSVDVESNGQIDVVGELTNTEAIPVKVAESRKNSIIINGCGDISKFTVDCIEDFELAVTSDGENLELVTTKVVDPEDSPVVNRTIKRGYDDLTSAFNTASTGDLIVVKEDQTTADRLSGKSVTVKGDNAGKPVTIKCTKDNFFFIAGSAGSLTLENIVIDGAEITEWKNPALEGNGGDLVLNDVTIRNYNASGSAIINLKDNDKLTANNLVIEDSSNGYISVGQNKNLEISGNCQFPALLNGSSQIEVIDNLDDNTLIEVIVADSREDTNLIIGSEDASKFSLTIPNSEKKLKLEAANGNLKLVSEIVEDPSTKPVYNQTSGYGFANLTSAISESKTGDILLLNENQTIDARVEPGAKELTIKGNGNTISRGENLSAILLLVNNAEGVLNLENVTIDGISKEVGSVAIEASGNGTVNLKDVTFANCKMTEGNIISIKGGGHMKAENVKTVSCTVPEGNGDIFVGTNSTLDMAGNNSFSVTLEGNGHINASELSNTTPVKIYLSSVPKENTLVVNGSEDISKFSIEAEGCKLIAQDGNIMVEVPAVEDPDDPNKEDPENPDDPNKEDPENPDDPNKEDPAEDTKPVYNETSKKGYDTLSEAFSAAETGAVIILKKDQTIAEHLSTDAREITIIGDDNVTISRDKGYNGMLFLVNTSGGALALENVTIDGAGVESNKVVIEASGNGVVNLTDVTMTNCVTIANQGIICIKSGGHVSAENLHIESSTVAPGNGEIYIGTNSSLTISGDCKFTMKHQGSGSIDATNATHSYAMNLMLDGDYEDDTVVVKGCQDLSKFNLIATGYVLAANEGNIVVKKSVNTGIGQVDLDGEEEGAEYYTLQGQRVNNPSSGFYIRRKGNEVMKVYVK